MVEFVTAYLEDALDAQARTLFEVHLLRCRGCAAYLQQLRVTIETTGTLLGGDLDPVFRARLMTAFDRTVVDILGRSRDETRLIDALRSGDAEAYAQLVDAHNAELIRMAKRYVRDHAAAEEVVQETWVALLQGVSKFEGRSSLRTWLFAVTGNIAKRRRNRERRELSTDDLGEGPVVDPRRFSPDDHAWAQAPVPFPEGPEGSALAKELRDVAQRALDSLPTRQRTVVALRDMLGFSSDEVCELMLITPANQRVLLHRGRAALRTALEDYLRGDDSYRLS